MLETLWQSVSVRTVMLETLWQSVDAGGEVPGRKGEEGVSEGEQSRGASSPSKEPLAHKVSSLAPLASPSPCLFCLLGSGDTRANSSAVSSRTTVATSSSKRLLARLSSPPPRAPGGECRASMKETLSSNLTLSRAPWSSHLT